MMELEEEVESMWRELERVAAEGRAFMEGVEEASRGAGLGQGED